MKFLDQAKVHIKVDTGMGRLGFSVEESFKLINKASKLQYINLEGIFTHLEFSFNSFIFNDPYFLACDIPAFAKNGVANIGRAVDSSSGTIKPIIKEPIDVYKKGVIVRLVTA